MAGPGSFILHLVTQYTSIWSICRLVAGPGSFILHLVTQYTSVWSICRLVAGPPATLCTDRSNITVDEGLIELSPQGEDVYTAAEALHPGQDITYVILSPHFVSYSLGCGASCDSHQTSWLESVCICGVRQNQCQTSRALCCIGTLCRHVCCKFRCIPT